MDYPSMRVMVPRCEVHLRTGRRCSRPAILLVWSRRFGLHEICRRHAHGRGIYRDHKGAALLARIFP